MDDCSEGIVRVAQQTKSLDPRQQGLFEWEISAGLNTDLDHNCTGERDRILYTVYMYNKVIIPIVVLSDSNGAILDTKPIHFKALDTCIYCSDGQCNCTVSYT